MIDLTGRTDVPVAEDVIRELAAHCRALHLDFLIVGAAARDLVIHARQQREPVRATEDIDIAVAVRVGDQFSQLARRMEKKHAEHKFEVLGVEVDVVPFGGLERERTIRFDDDHVLDVTGLLEADATAIPVTMPQGTVIRVASAPAQTALKVLAWRDRHLENPKDGLDLRLILAAMAEDPFVDEVWDDHEALDETDSDIFAAASYHYARLAAQPFTESDGSAVMDVLSDQRLRSLLIRDMRGELSPCLLDAYERGFAAGLGH